MSKEYYAYLLTTREIHAKIKTYASEHQLTISELTEKILQEFLNKAKKPNKG